MRTRGYDGKSWISLLFSLRLWREKKDAWVPPRIFTILSLFILIYIIRKNKWRNNYNPSQSYIFSSLEIEKICKEIIDLLLFFFTYNTFFCYLITIKIFSFISFIWFNQSRGDYYHFIYFLPLHFTLSK